MADCGNGIYLNALGIASALGVGGDTVLANLLAGQAPGMRYREGWVPERGAVRLGEVDGDLPPWPPQLNRFAARNNRLLLAVAGQIAAPLTAARECFGAERIGIVLGSSTSGIAEGEAAVAADLCGEGVPADYHYDQQKMAGASLGLARALGLGGVAYTVSTACSSSAKAFAGGRDLLAMDLCDAVLVGGADSLCGLTINGFAALESVAADACQPFARGRDGINIGEGAALFLMTREPIPGNLLTPAGDAIRLAGVGSASDAFHISAPDPTGAGAETAMRSALTEAGIGPGEIDYINLHGTATPQNDAMESAAVARVFGPSTPCTSTKALTGHTLGAAGAIEVGLSALLLSSGNAAGVVPRQIFNGERDPTLEPIGLLEAEGEIATTGPRYCLSNSFAFGGSNCAVVIAG